MARVLPEQWLTAPGRKAPTPARPVARPLTFSERARSQMAPPQLAPWRRRTPAGSRGRSVLASRPWTNFRRSLGWLPDDQVEASVVREATAQQLVRWPVSKFCLVPLPRQGLILGYGGFAARVIKEGVRKLAAVLG